VRSSPQPCATSAIDWPSPVVNQFEPQNCRRAVIKRIGWIGSGSVNAPILTAIAPRFSAASASAVFAAAALRAEQSMSTSTPSWSVCRRIQSAIGASPSARTSIRSGASARLLKWATPVTMGPKAENAGPPQGKAKNGGPPPRGPGDPIDRPQPAPAHLPKARGREGGAEKAEARGLVKFPPGGKIPQP